MSAWHLDSRYGIKVAQIRAPKNTESEPMSKETIAIACDHGGLALKQELVELMQAEGHTVLNLGTDTTASVDYPEFGYALAEAIKDGRASRGVLICGSGIGISIAANRFAHIRAALVHDVTGARLSREHNDANVICFGARTTGPDIAVDCLKTFLTTDFDGGERHQRRVDLLSNP